MSGFLWLLILLAKKSVVHFLLCICFMKLLSFFLQRIQMCRLSWGQYLVSSSSSSLSSLSFTSFWSPFTVGFLLCFHILRFLTNVFEVLNRVYFNKFLYISPNQILVYFCMLYDYYNKSFMIRDFLFILKHILFKYNSFYTFTAVVVMQFILALIYWLRSSETFKHCV